MERDLLKKVLAKLAITAPVIEAPKVVQNKGIAHELAAGSYLWISRTDLWHSH
jgi:hypothetical protein